MPPRFKFKLRWSAPRWHLIGARNPDLTGLWAPASDEKRAESVRKYAILNDKSCAGFREKVKKQLAWTDVAKEVLTRTSATCQSCFNRS